MDLRSNGAQRHEVEHRSRLFADHRTGLVDYGNSDRDVDRCSLLGPRGSCLHRVVLLEVPLARFFLGCFNEYRFDLEQDPTGSEFPRGLIVRSAGGLGKPGPPVFSASISPSKERK